MEAGVLEEPLVDRGGLAGGVVAQYQVQVQAFRHGSVDELEEAQELLVPVLRLVLGDQAGASPPAGLLPGSGCGPSGVEFWA